MFVFCLVFYNLILRFSFCVCAPRTRIVTAKNSSRSWPADKNLCTFLFSFFFFTFVCARVLFLFFFFVCMCVCACEHRTLYIRAPISQLPISNKKENNDNSERQNVCVFFFFPSFFFLSIQGIRQVAECKKKKKKEKCTNCLQEQR